MEMFCLPFGEIEERFTRSELIFLAWRSQEQHYQFKKKLKKSTRGSSTQEESVDRPHYGPGDVIPEGLPDEYFNEEGEVDLSKVTGAQARKYLEHIGMPFPPAGVARTVVKSTVDGVDPAAAYRNRKA